MSFIPPLETLYNKVIKIKICSTFPSLGFSNTPERRRADTTEESKIHKDQCKSVTSVSSVF